MVHTCYDIIDFTYFFQVFGNILDPRTSHTILNMIKKLQKFKNWKKFSELDLVFY
jgi:hypothetical protein